MFIFGHFFKYLFSFFPCFWAYELSIEPPFCLFMAISLILTTWCPSAIFWRNFCFHFFRFLGPNSFRMSPIMYGLDGFWHFTPNMPKRPLLHAKFFSLLFRFLGLKSFRISPILYCLDDFCDLTQNMPKHPLFDKKSFYFPKYLTQKKNFKLFGVSLRRLYRFHIQKPLLTNQRL